MIYGDRIKQAREIRGITQAYLAEHVGVSQSAIAQLEQDDPQLSFNPSESLLRAIAFHLRFPMGFFERKPGPDFSLGSLWFRKKSSLKSQEKSRIRQLARFYYEITEDMAGELELVPIRIPRLSNENPCEAARATRAMMGLSPDTPIKNLFFTLELNGAIVIALREEMHDEYDAFSLWSDNEPRRPVIVINCDKPGDRQRFSLAHELGHLVMHQSFLSPGKADREAHEFASEFLMPAEVLRNEIQTPVTLSGLAKLKPRWGASIQALIKRSESIGNTTARQTTYLFQKLTMMGWREREPANLDVPIEKPRAFIKMAETVYGQMVTSEQIASRISGPSTLVKQILDAYAGKPEIELKDQGSQPTNRVLPFRKISSN
jgi:Zn-dependent peptidase ImmA (M78 family)/transcriptional regulator with XRE-family HTH domain